MVEDERTKYPVSFTIFCVKHRHLKADYDAFYQ